MSIAPVVTRSATELPLSDGVILLAARNLVWNPSRAMKLAPEPLIGDDA